MALRPLMLTDDDLAGIRTAEQRELITVDNRIFKADFAGFDADDSSSETDPEDMTQNDRTEKIDKFSEAFSKSIAASSYDLIKTDAKSIRPRLNSAMQVALARNMASKVKRIWPPSDVQLIPKDNADPADLTAEDLHRSHRADVEQVLQESEDPEKKSEKDEEERRQEFWKLQKTLNQVSSTPPDHLTACRSLGLDSDKPMLKDGLLRTAPLGLSHAYQSTDSLGTNPSAASGLVDPAPHFTLDPALLALSEPAAVLNPVPAPAYPQKRFRGKSAENPIEIELDPDDREFTYEDPEGSRTRDDANEPEMGNYLYDSTPAEEPAMNQSQATPEDEHPGRPNSLDDAGLSTSRERPIGEDF